jgi:hypothetical protein
MRIMCHYIPTGVVNYGQKDISKRFLSGDFADDATVTAISFKQKGPNPIFTFRQNKSYESYKVISAEQTPTHGLQNLLHDPAPPSRSKVLSAPVPRRS